MRSDVDLLSRLAASRDAAAMAALSARYLPLVYAAARRRTGDAMLAEDVSQAVFLVLLDKASSLDGRRPLADWLLKVTRYAASNAVRQRARRSKHELAAARSEAVMSPPDGLEALESHATWAQHLDDALDRLPAVDRRVILLRFYDGAEFSAVAQSLEISEVAARKRVTRAVQKLRNHFVRRGISVPGTELAAALPAVLCSAPPAALAAAVPALSTTSPAAGAAANVLAKGTLKTMLIAKTKFAAAVVITLLLAGTGTRIGLLARAAATAPLAPLPVRPVTGWLKIESETDGLQGPREVTFVEPSTGRWLRTRADAPNRVEEFDDPVRGIAGRELQAIQRFVIGQGGDPTRSAPPYTEAAMLKELNDPRAFMVATPRPPAGDERITDIVPSPRPNGEKMPERMPMNMEAHADVATGLIRKVIALPSSDGKQARFDLMTVTHVAGPPMDFDFPDKLPLPGGMTLIDNRPAPEITALLKQLDDVVTRGPGFETGLIIRRSGDAYTGTYYDDSAEMTLCAGNAKRFVIATWNVGKESGRFFEEKQTVPKPAGWPKPTLAAVLACVGSTRPNQFVVYDGDTCWASNNMIGGQPERAGRTVTQQHDSLWRNWGLAQLWAQCPSPGSLFTHFNLTKDPNDANHVTLEATFGDYFTFGPATQPAIHKSGTVRLTLAADLGPYPLRIETISDGDMQMASGGGARLERIDIDPAAQSMFRDPVRVPEHWRLLHLDDGDASLPDYYTLIPFENGTIPAAWYADPAKTWQVGNH